MAPDYDHLLLMQKVEVFEHALDNTVGDDLAKILWFKSPSSEVSCVKLSISNCFVFIIRHIKLFSGELFLASILINFYRWFDFVYFMLFLLKNL